MESCRYCLGCGYRLDNIVSNFCPECGRAYSLIDCATISNKGKLSFLERCALKPCRWVFPVSVLATLYVVFISIPVPGDILPFILWLCLTFVIIGSPYLARQAILRNLVRVHGIPPTVLEVDRRLIRRSRRAFIIAAWLIVTHLPFYLVFLPSLPWLNQAANYEWNVRPSNEPRPTRIWVGLLPVNRIYAGYGGVTFYLSTGQTLMYREHLNPEDPNRHEGFWWIWMNWYVPREGL